MGRASNRKRCGEHRDEMAARRARASEHDDDRAAMRYLDPAFDLVNTLTDRSSLTAADLLAAGFLSVVGSSTRIAAGQSIVAADPVTVMAQTVEVDGIDCVDGLAEEMAARRNLWLGALAATAEGLEFLRSATTALVSACASDRPEVCTVAQLAEYHQALDAAQLVVPDGCMPTEVLDAVDAAEISAPSADFDALERFRAQVDCGVTELEERTFADALRVVMTRVCTDGGATFDEALDGAGLRVLLGFGVLELAGKNSDPYLDEVAPYLSCGGPLQVMLAAVDEILAVTDDTATALASLLVVPEMHVELAEHVFGWCAAGADDCLGELALSIGGLSRFETSDGLRVRLGAAASAAVRRQIERREAELGRPLADDDLIFGDDDGEHVEWALRLFGRAGVAVEVCEAIAATGILPTPFGLPSVDPDENAELAGTVDCFGGEREDLSFAELALGVATVSSLIDAIDDDNDLGARLVEGLAGDPDGVEAQMLRAAVDVGMAQGADVESAYVWARRLGSLALAEEVRAAGSADDVCAAAAFCFLCAAHEARIAAMA